MKYIKCRLPKGSLLDTAILLLTILFLTILYFSKFIKNEFIRRFKNVTFNVKF